MLTWIEILDTRRQLARFFKVTEGISQESFLNANVNLLLNEKENIRLLIGKAIEAANQSSQRVDWNSVRVGLLADSNLKASRAMRKVWGDNAFADFKHMFAVVVDGLEEDGADCPEVGGIKYSGAIKLLRFLTILAICPDDEFEAHAKDIYPHMWAALRNGWFVAIATPHRIEMPLWHKGGESQRVTNVPFGCAKGIVNRACELAMNVVPPAGKSVSE